MEVHMELSKKTTILFPPDLHEHLTRVARERGTSLGELVREACESVYGAVSAPERRAAVRGMAALALPVADVATMKRESVPEPREIRP
jgi:hypothetical protein